VAPGTERWCINAAHSASKNKISPGQPLSKAPANLPLCNFVTMPPSNVLARYLGPSATQPHLPVSLLGVASPGIQAPPVPRRRRLAESPRRILPRLRRRFILLAPTARFLDANAREILACIGTAVLGLDSIVILPNHGALKPI
jgi:hypothetical protein